MLSKDKSKQKTAVTSEPASELPKHRIDEVRRELGISIKSFAIGLKLTKEEINAVLNPLTDLKLSELKLIADFLNVGIEQLLIEPNDNTIPSHSKQKLYKTARALESECDKNSSEMRMVQTLLTQLDEIFGDSGTLRKIADQHKA